MMGPSMLEAVLMEDPRENTWQNLTQAHQWYH